MRDLIHDPGNIVAKFLEIEHKFLVDNDFDVNAFFSSFNGIEPEVALSVSSRDVYYLLTDLDNHVLRYRFDEGIQELTLKSLGGDTEVRKEINLALGDGDQLQAVEAFAKTLGARWHGVIKKEVQVRTYKLCEVVYYTATNIEGRRVCCVEFEARTSAMQTSEIQAPEILQRFEEMAGFSGKMREKRSLLELLYPEAINDIGSRWSTTAA